LLSFQNVEKSWSPAKQSLLWQEPMKADFEGFLHRNLYVNC
jgi:hypothetical protein